VDPVHRAHLTAQRRRLGLYPELQDAGLLFLFGSEVARLDFDLHSHPKLTAKTRPRSSQACACGEQARAQGCFCDAYSGTSIWSQAEPPLSQAAELSPQPLSALPAAPTSRQYVSPAPACPAPSCSSCQMLTFDQVELSARGNQGEEVRGCA
jgi:hypothetical protein